MTRIAVTGFASLDYPLGIAGFAKGDTTSMVTRRSCRSWPRLGGCAAFVATAAVNAGANAAPVTWVGSDAEGEGYRRALAAEGCNIDAVETVDANRSPATVLVYQEDGSCICLYDPVFAGQETLSEAQRAVIRDASYVCVTVGPPQLVAPILDSRSANSRLAWVLKNDTHAFPDEIRERLAAEADVIFCNGSERGLVPTPRPESLVVETHGPREVVIEVAGDRKSLPVDPVSVRDTTGAGDTFAGGFLAAMAAGEDDPVLCGEAGIAAVRALLTEREKEEKTERQ